MLRKKLFCLWKTPLICSNQNLISALPKLVAHLKRKSRSIHLVNFAVPPSFKFSKVMVLRSVTMSFMDVPLTINKICLFENFDFYVILFSFSAQSTIPGIFPEMYISTQLCPYFGTIHILRHHIFGPPSPPTSACF